MKIKNLRVNHFEEFLGNRSDPLTLSWVVCDTDAKVLTSSRVVIALDQSMTNIVYDSGWDALDPLMHQVDYECCPRTKYYWQVFGRADNGDAGASEIAVFETGKRDEDWQAKWITSPFDKDTHFYAVTDFEAEKQGVGIVSARAYAAAHGSYELYMNGEKAGEEYLAPGYHSYDFRDMVYTYDLTPYLKENNRIGAMLSPAWFKGRFGLPGHGARQTQLYGERMDFLCEIRLTYADGTEKIIGTDENWICHASPVTMSNIYDGEDYDARLEVPGWCEPKTGLNAASQNAEGQKKRAGHDAAPASNGGQVTAQDGCGWQAAVLTEPVSWTLKKAVPLQDRTNPPIQTTEVRKAVLIETPEGDRILDFGQVLTGWMEADVCVPDGTEVVFACAEVLEHGNWYRKNLRSARAELHYISNGKPAHVRPHGTFFGFRYLKVTGMEPDPEKITASVIHSDIPRTGWVETDHELVNKLISNAYWGQRDNFLDVPTDCPQRDERLGWTGDTQVFSGTACFNQYTPAFYAKYLEDVTLEQKQLNGMVPGYVPLATPKDTGGAFVFCSCGWGDVVTVVPWNVYMHYGDKVQLFRDYPAMKAYVDYLFGLDEADGSKRLWQTGGHTADWLALDNYKNPHAPNGGTDEHYIASAYYAHSSRLVALAAAELGLEEDAAYYEELSRQIRSAMVREYFSPNGRCVCDTQTAYLIALKFDIVPEKMRPRLIGLLQKKLYEDRYHLQTGFLGTPLLCPTLSENGLNDLAYTLVLGEDYPGWLHEVKLGATTLWERWNSVLPDGTVNRNGMSSMNHYAYGAVVEWFYRHVCGLNEAQPGWRRAVIKPMPNAQLKCARAVYESASGRWESSWQIEDERITYNITVPFHTTAQLLLDNMEAMELEAGSYTFTLPVTDEIRKRPRELPPLWRGFMPPPDKKDK